MKCCTAYLGLCNLEISNLDTTGCEIWDLEFDLDRPLTGLATANTTHATTKTTGHTTTSLVIASNTGEAELGAHEELFIATKLFNLPDDGALLGGVVDRADVRSESRRVCVFGNRDNNLDVICGRPALELGLGFEHVFDAGARVRLDHALDPDQRLDLRVETVGHELELAIGRNE